MMKINNFRGKLADISAKKEALILVSAYAFCVPEHLSVLEVTNQFTILLFTNV